MTGDIQYRTALIDNSDQSVDIKTVKAEFKKDCEYRNKHIFTCPCCGEEMEAVLGEIREIYFRHKNDSCGGDNYLHSTAEQVFFEEYNNCLKNGLPFEITVYPEIQCNSACIIKKKASCSKRHKEKTVIDLTLMYKRITPERSVLIDGCYRRPDLLLESESGEKLWVEIWVSHETEEEKRSLENILEIKISSHEDIEILRRHKLVQTGPSDTRIRYFNWKEECLTPELQISSEDTDKYLREEFGHGDSFFPRRQFFQKTGRPLINLANPLDMTSLKELPVRLDIPYWKKDKEIEWVNLGLSSGTLWSKEFMGNMSFEEAQREYPQLIPSLEQYQELVSSCKTTGPFPAGFIGPNGVLLEMYEGDFWTNMGLTEEQALFFHREYLRDFAAWTRSSPFEGTCFAKADKRMRMCVRLVKKLR